MVKTGFNRRRIMQVTTASNYMVL